METPELIAIGGLFLTIIGLAINNFINIRKDEITFRKNKAEQLSKELLAQLNGVYDVLDIIPGDSVEESKKIKARSQTVRRSFDPVMILIKIHFPRLLNEWETHRENLDGFAKYVSDEVDKLESTLPDIQCRVDSIFNSHDVLIKSIIELYPQLTRHWLHTFICQDECCK